MGPMNTDVRGTVKIQSSDPHTAPAIVFNYLSTPDERRNWVDAIRKTRRLIETKAMDEYRVRERSPGKQVQTDEEILDWVARDGESA